MFCSSDEKIKKHMNKQASAWRTELNQFERGQFIPFMVGYVDGFIVYFEEIVRKCEEHVRQPHFWPQLEELIKKFGQPADEQSAKLTAKQYFGLMGEVIKRDYLEPLRELQRDASGIQDVSSLGLWLNRLKTLAGSILNVKDKVFLFRLSGWFTIRDLETGKVNDPIPYPNLAIFFVPFQSLIDNLHVECTYLLGSIEKWSAQQLEWKTSYLNALSAAYQLKNTKVTLWVNLIGIVVAIVLSWVFLVATPPFEKLRATIENDQLKQKFLQTDMDLDSLRKDIGSKSLQIIELETAKKSVEGELEKIKLENEKLKQKKAKATSSNSQH